MKQGIHPQWQECVVTCSCGNTFTTSGSQASMQVDICSACHPFFTGEVKFVDRAGRVDKFNQRRAAAQQKKAKSDKKKTAKKQAEQKSYKQILREQQDEMKSQAAEDKKVAKEDK
jgi:large subunit ribosomal protein L31